VLKNALMYYEQSTSSGYFTYCIAGKMYKA